MIGSDEMILTGRYKGFSASLRYDLQGKAPEQVAFAIRQVIDLVEPQSYAFSGIDTAKIDAFVGSPGRGAEAAHAFLCENSPGSISSALSEAMEDPLLKSAGESYLLNRLLSSCSLPSKPASDESLPSGKEEIGDMIAFIAKYQGWVTIKKLGVEGAKDYEVCAILAGVNHSLIRKGFELLGASKGAMAGERIAKGKRRSWGNLRDCRAEAGKAMGGERNEDAAMLVKMCETLGFMPYATPAMLTAAHDDIKPPKTRGRKPKG